MEDEENRKQKEEEEEEQNNPMKVLWQQHWSRKSCSSEQFQITATKLAVLLQFAQCIHVTLLCLWDTSS